MIHLFFVNKIKPLNKKDVVEKLKKKLRNRNRNLNLNLEEVVQVQSKKLNIDVLQVKYTITKQKKLVQHIQCLSLFLMTTESLMVRSAPPSHRFL